jgi:hypothetical protein
MNGRAINRKAVSLGAAYRYASILERKHGLRGIMQVADRWIPWSPLNDLIRVLTSGLGTADGDQPALVATGREEPIARAVQRAEPDQSEQGGHMLEENPERCHPHPRYSGFARLRVSLERVQYAPVRTA